MFFFRQGGPWAKDARRKRAKISEASSQGAARAPGAAKGVCLFGMRKPAAIPGRSPARALRTPAAARSRVLKSCRSVRIIALGIRIESYADLRIAVNGNAKGKGARGAFSEGLRFVAADSANCLALAVHEAGSLREDGRFVLCPRHLRSRLHIPRIILCRPSHNLPRRP